MSNLLNTLCRGLVGYISFLATTSSHTIYSEYILYEPILRILYAKGCRAHCEYAVRKTPRGDNERIDFRVFNNESEFSIEVKWAKKRTINIDRDIDKLGRYKKLHNSYGYLIVFGHYRYLKQLRFSKEPKILSEGKVINWDSGKTNYAARWYRIV